MKFFSLLSDEELHIAPEKDKIIPAKDFTKLKKANDILKKVKHEAHEYKKKCIHEIEELKEQASQEGFAEGLNRFNKQLLHLDHEIKSLRDEFQKKILPIALQAAKKILSEELRLHADRIVDIVLQSLKPIIQHHQIKIYVNKTDLPELEKNKEKIKSILEQVESLALEEREDIEPGGCIIETEAGIINAQLENQWRSLEAAFKDFMEKKTL